MEFRPYSLADNFLLVHFVGLDDRVWFAVAPEVAEKTVEALCFPTDDEGRPADQPDVWIQVVLADGSIALLGRDHIALVTHTYEFGYAEGVPPKGIYGVPVPEQVMEEYEWGPPALTIAVEGVGVLDLNDQTRESAETIPDTVPDGFLVAPFLSFTDDDGETNVVATDRVAFVVVHTDLL